MGAAPGQFFDGQSAGRHDVEVSLSGDARALVIEGDTFDAPMLWPLARLRGLRDHAVVGQMILTLHAATQDESPRDPSRLILRDAALIAQIETRCPDLHRADLHKGTWGKVISRVALAVAAVGLMLFVILPRMADTLATLIPIEREIAFGKTVTAQMERLLGGSGIGTLTCDAPEGKAALDTMLARLTQGREMQYDLNVSVMDHPMLNAFAAPGGQVVLIRGLIDQADSPETVAAVLAHEIAHVESRDATRHALRAAGSAGLLAMVLGDFAGGSVAVVMGETLLSASYTREAELAADAFAIEMLNAANVDSSGMAAFFDHLHDLEDEMPDIPAYFLTHPASDARAARARENAAAQAGTQTVLSEAEWQALRTICG